MTTQTRTQIVCLFAALICGFVTIGTSIAPAIGPAAALLV